MFVSNNYKLLFLEVPRTGSYSITNALARLDPESPTVQLRKQQRELVGYHSLQLPDRVDESYIIIAAHRNPYDRLWSHWKYRHEGGNPDLFKSIAWPRYVMWACNPDSTPEINNAMLELPITEMLDCDRVTHWLNFERLATSWKQLEENTGLPLPALNWINISVTMGRYQEAYNSELASMVAERFAADFKRFNYNIGSWSGDES